MVESSFFLEKPEIISDYQHGEVVTREKFICFLEKSFAVSVGIYPRQLLYMEWVRTKNGFEYVSVIQDLIKNGGWKLLTKEEREHFLTVHANVPKHKLESQEFPRSPEYVFREQLRNLLDTKSNYTSDLVSRFGDLSLLSFDDLVKNLDMVYPRNKD